MSNRGSPPGAVVFDSLVPARNRHVCDTFHAYKMMGYHLAKKELSFSNIEYKFH